MKVLNFDKGNGLAPVIIQDVTTLQVLMLGYMNEEAFLKTKKEGVVTFFSRTKNRLWTKGETSGNYLKVIDITVDCDADTLLITVVAPVATCHTGAKSCFGEAGTKGFIYELEKTISKRIEEKSASSYTNTLYNKGIHKVAQKVGEEAVELVIEAMRDQEDLFKNEAADLLYHLMILLKAKGLSLLDIEEVLKGRSKGE